MYVRPYEEPLMEFAEYRAHKLLLLVAPPLLLVLGTVGNTLAVLVLTRRALRAASTYTYLAVLAATDVVVLYVGLLRLWLGELTGYDIRETSDWSCKLVSLLGYTVSACAVWLLAAVTVERYVVTVHALRAPAVCTRARAARAIAAIFALLLSVNLHFAFTVELRQYESDAGAPIMTCDAAAGHELLVVEVWPWVDACLYCFVPFVLISILNAFIIGKVVLAKRKRLKMSSAVGGSSALTNNGERRTSGGQGGGESSTRVTVMLLTVSFTFLITTLPMNVTTLWSAFIDTSNISLEFASKYKLARTVSELLMYTNHCTNFYLYLLTGQKFRQELFAMFRCGGGTSSSSRKRTKEAMYRPVKNTAGAPTAPRVGTGQQGDNVESGSTTDGGGTMGGDSTATGK